MYHLLALLMLSSLIWFGNRYRTSVHFAYWKAALIPILAYILGYGFRDGWGVDTAHYKDIYDFLQDTDIGLWGINYFLRSVCGFNYTSALVVYSLILIVGIFAIVKGYKKEAIFILPLLWVLSSSSTGLIRWWVASGWLLMSTAKLLQGNKVGFVVYAVLSVLTHTGTLMLLPIILLSYQRDFFTKRAVTVIIFIAFSVLLDGHILGQKIISPIVDFLSQHMENEKLSAYNRSADEWFGQWAVIKVASNETLGLLNRVRMFIVNFFVIYYGFEAKKDYPHGYFWYNLAAMSCIVYNCTLGFELVERYSMFLRLSIAFVCGFAIVHNVSKRTVNPIANFLVWAFVFVNLFYRDLFGLGILMNYDYYRYIWD